MTTQAVANTPADGTSVPAVRGVLFDIDDTLVDLQAAMKGAMIAASTPLLPHFGPQDWTDFAQLYMDDPQRYYDRFVAGEFTFAQQRGLRARLVFEHFGYQGFDQEAEQQWIADFEAAQPLAIKAYVDVVPVLDALDRAGIPYGAVSNNVFAYQREKLDHADLQRIEVLVGIDALKVAKPDPRVFHEGCRLIGTLPEETLYVGDNYTIDGIGSLKAGLQPVWLNRHATVDSAEKDDAGVHQISALPQLVSFIPVLGEHLIGDPR